MTDQDEKPDWAQVTTARIGQRLADLRRARQMSAQTLADETRALGYELPRGTIAKVENGRRGVSAPELLVLARALAVPPWTLLVDIESYEEVAAIPGRQPEQPWEFVRWWRDGHCGEVAAEDYPGVYQVHRWLEFEKWWAEAVETNTAWLRAKSELEDERSRGTVQFWIDELAGTERWIRRVLDSQIADFSSKWETELIASGKAREAASLGVYQPRGGADGDD